MKFRNAVLSLIIAVVIAAPVNADNVIRTASELAKITAQRGTAGRRFELHVTAISSLPENPGNPKKFNGLFVMDESGGAHVHDARKTSGSGVVAGDRILIAGKLDALLPLDKDSSRVMANCQRIEVLSHGTAPEPTHIKAHDFDSDTILNTPVKIDGILVGIRPDEIDPLYTMLVLDCSGRMLYAAALTAKMRRSVAELRQFIGATIQLSGIPYLHIGLRQHSRRWLGIIDGDDTIRMLKPPSGDLFRAPEIDAIDTLSPEAVTALGRRRTVGRVLAVWNGDTLLIRTATGEPMKLNIVTTTPIVGDCIEAVGYAETDLFHANLASAIWRPVDSLHLPPETIADVPVKELFENEMGKRRIDVRRHGQTLRIKGVAQGVTSDGQSDCRLLVSSGGYTVAVDCGVRTNSTDRIENGSLVSVTGICVIDTETWNRHSTLPQTHGLFIVTRSQSDIAVISAPPWWTTGRLLTVIASLLLILLAVLVWNRLLHSIAEKRGKYLANEELDRLAADLKSAERTRLAVELHDSIAQNLSGITMEIGTALNGAEVLPPVATQHLSRALKTLDSCRVELRNCIWDLRSSALDEPDMDKAIRIALGPSVGKTRLVIRFNVPRERFTENTARTILNIIRELASNAVRHGHATEVKVAGSLENETLRFSVRDNGGGFVPGRRPGVMEGHFGLQGIKERVSALDGKMEIESSLENGTKVAITIHIPFNADKEKI